MKKDLYQLRAKFFSFKSPLLQRKYDIRIVNISNAKKSYIFDAIPYIREGIAARNMRDHVTNILIEI